LAITHCESAARRRILGRTQATKDCPVTHEELTARFDVLEERVAKLAGALIVLLEAIDDGMEKTAASHIREVLKTDLRELQ
jgi:hypothetical protein